MKQRRVKRSFPREFREAAVRQVVEGGRAAAEVAQSLEMSEKTLGNWVRKARSGRPLVQGERARPLDPVQAELSRLRAENARLRMDNAILKKAAAYFAKESL